MLCPRCKRRIDFIRQMKKWYENDGRHAVIDKEFPIYIALRCRRCHDITACVWIEATTEVRTYTDFRGEEVVWHVPEWMGKQDQEAQADLSQSEENSDAKTNPSPAKLLHMEPGTSRPDVP